MLAKHRLLVLVFAGGCVSGAAVIGLWQTDTRTVPNETPSVRMAERNAEPTSADPAADFDRAARVTDDDEANPATDAPVSPPKRAEPTEDHPSEEGSSLAELLHRLETAYRQAAAAPAPEPKPAATVAPAPSPEAAVREEPRVAVATPVATPAAAPATNAPRATAPAEAADAQPILVASNDQAPTTNVYYGDVQQNTNVGRVQQGDVYVMPSVAPYAPYYALPPARTHSPAANAPYPGIPRAVHFRNNPNPAGSGVFNYPIDGPFKYPVDLVH
jgi:hypothetical protein